MWPRLTISPIGLKYLCKSSSEIWLRLAISPTGSKYLCKSSSEIWLRLAILPTGSKYLCKSSSKIWPRLAFSHIESLSLISIWNERGIVRKAHNSALHASPFWFSTHSFFVNQATTRHNISYRQFCILCEMHLKFDCDSS